MLYYLSRLIQVMRMSNSKARTVNIINEGKWDTEDGLPVHYVIVKTDRPIRALQSTYGDHN